MKRDRLLGDLLGQVLGQASTVGGVHLLFVEVDVWADPAELSGIESLVSHALYLRDR
ncbi:MAG: hypothetical protein ACYDB3_01885 [Acidimicrobiales bacterium]